MKRIILLCDGTWQSSLEHAKANPTNISRLARAILPVTDDGITQLTYYHPGVGSTGGLWEYFTGGEIARLVKCCANKLGAFGDGILEQMEDVYSVLAYNYVPGDEIFLFGFSRGSYMVRALCSFILEFGIFKKGGMSEFLACFKLYMSNNKDKLAEIREKLARNGVLTVDGLAVKAIGCFDTVGALGIPKIFPWQSSQYEFLDLQLNKDVEHAFHALALDETRLAFRPTLWFFDVKAAPSQQSVANYKQVWFEGSHGNIGGGNMSGAVWKSNLLRTRGSNTANVLSDGTLIWMVAQCIELLQFDDEYLHTDIRGAHTVPDGHLVYDKEAVQVKQSQPSWIRGPVNNVYASFGIVFLFLGVMWRSVLGYFPARHDYDFLFARWYSELKHILFPPSLDGYVTNEFVHESAVVRARISGSPSKALRAVDVVDDKNEVLIPGSSRYKTRKPVHVEKYSAYEQKFWELENQDIFSA